MNAVAEVPAPPRPLRALTALEARALSVLVEKERTVPDTYPLTLNALVAGCNQKSSRNPVIEAAEADVLAAVNSLKGLSLVIESSGGRVMRYAQNVKRVLQVPAEAVAILATLMLRGPQTAAELRSNSDRLCRISDASAVEAYLQELGARPAGALAVELPRQPGSRENRWMHCLCGDAGMPPAVPPGATAAAHAPGAVRTLPQNIRVAADTFLQIDLPEVLAEVTVLLARYGEALANGDSETIEAMRWQSSRAMLEGCLRGVGAVGAAGAAGAADAAGQSLSVHAGGAPSVHRTRITAFGRDCATSLIELRGQGAPGIVREIQTWARLPEGWRIVAAHAGGWPDPARGTRPEELAG